MMALENNLVVDSDAELKAFLSSILSSEGIVVNINRTLLFFPYPTPFFAEFGATLFGITYYDHLQSG